MDVRQRSPYQALMGLAVVSSLWAPDLTGQAAGGRQAAAIQVGATVVDTRLSVAAVRPARIDARRGAGDAPLPAAEWRLSGVAHAVLGLQLAVPSALADAERVTAAPLPIAFPPSVERGLRHRAVGRAVVNPPTGVETQLGAGPEAAMSVWLGGVVDPVQVRPGGTYRGTATLTVFCP
jgi:hypothetical protein